MEKYPLISRNTVVVYIEGHSSNLASEGGREREREKERERERESWDWCGIIMEMRLTFNNYAGVIVKEAHVVKG